MIWKRMKSVKDRNTLKQANVNEEVGGVLTEKMKCAKDGNSTLKA